MVDDKRFSIDKLSIKDIQLIRSCVIEFRNGYATYYNNFDLTPDTKSELKLAIEHCDRISKKLQRQLERMEVSLMYKVLI
jgi:hypothetical protein